MPHALTERQKEYLSFLRDYIRKNEMTPRLEEVAGHFGVKLPTAHKTLDALEKKGYLIARRESASGYFVRLAERGIGIEKLIGVFVIGKIDAYGEIHAFPEDHGQIPVVLIGVDEYQVFALEATEDIHQANILVGDYLICDYGLRPRPGDIAIMPWGKHSGRWFLCRMKSLTSDRDTPWFDVANAYPIPGDLIDEELGQKYNWIPLAYDEDTDDYFSRIAEEEDVPMGAIPPELVMATVLRLRRNLAF
ncbi:MAG: hypothetical protein MUO62_07980 [Anaerolineales bacterium]|nr:hypothetical protein [Anaerolineales bacterium]